jgi:hypothetical protein
MLRYIVAFCAVSAGAVIAVADFAVALRTLTPQQRIAGKKSPETDRLIFEACIVFYGVAYTTGRIIYQLSGAHAQAEELRRWSRSHMAILNLVGGGWLLHAGWQVLQHAVVRPALIVGVILLAVATYDWWVGLRKLRGKRHSTQGFPFV